MTHVRLILAALALAACGAATSFAQDSASGDALQLPVADPAAGTPPPQQPGVSPTAAESFFGFFGSSGGFGPTPGAGDADIGPKARFVADEAIILTWSETFDTAWGFSKTTGKWTKQELDPPAQPPSVGGGMGVMQAGSTIYAYSGTTGRWDVLRLPKDHTPRFAIHNEFVLVNDGADIYTFADAAGRWTSPDGENVNEGAEETGEVRIYPLLGPRGAPSADPLTGDSTPVEDLRRTYKELDQTSAQLARRYREQSTTKGPNHPDLARLKEQLAAAVKQAFQARQQLHQVELAEFQRRMQDVQRTIEARQRIQDEIIERRVNELLDPSLKWDATASAGDRAGAMPTGELAPEGGGAADVAGMEQQGSGMLSPLGPATGSMSPRPQRELGDLPELGQWIDVGVVSEAGDPEGIVISSAELGGIRSGEELLVIRNDQFNGNKLVGRIEIVQAGDESAIGRVLVTRRVNVNNRYQADRLQPGDNVARVSTPPPVEPLDSPVDAARETSANNLKRLMLAMHNYHDTYNHFPPAVIRGKDGQGGPPHSWRVALLPFLDQQALYNEYRFDEPWDSEHNRTLLGKMPAVYRSPLDKPDSPHASYFALVTPGFAGDETGALFGRHGEGGGGTAGSLNIPAAAGPPALPAIPPAGAGPLGEGSFAPGDFAAGAAVEPSWHRGTVFSRPGGTRLIDIIDGTSNTIALVEAKRSIPWTQPHDIAYVPDQSLPVLGGWFPEGWHAGLGDGSVKFLSADNDDATIRALFTIGGGEVVQPKVAE
jgi:hypothetical protein